MAGGAAAGFGALARARRDRALHPVGDLWHATVVLDGGPAGVPALAEPRTVKALLRVSRAIGLPGPLPDVLGVAVRLCDLHGPGRDQDLLFASCPPPPAHIILAPAREGHVWFTGLLPYRVGHVRGVLVARRTADLRYDLLLTRPGRRGGRPLGHVAGGPERASGDVRFDPIRNAAPDLRQDAGPLDAVRARSYAASREGSTAGRR
jgi:hypothetical protein